MLFINSRNNQLTKANEKNGLKRLVIYSVVAKF